MSLLHELERKWRRKEVENGEAGDEWEAAIYRECADDLLAALAAGDGAVAQVETSRGTVENLLPCPFCGSRAELKEHWDTGDLTVFVRCTGLMCQLAENQNDVWIDIEQWNRRSALNPGGSRE